MGDTSGDMRLGRLETKKFLFLYIRQVFKKQFFKDIYFPRALFFIMNGRKFLQRVISRVSKAMILRPEYSEQDVVFHQKRPATEFIGCKSSRKYPGSKDIKAIEVYFHVLLLIF